MSRPSRVIVAGSLLSALVVLSACGAPPAAPVATPPQVQVTTLTPGDVPIHKAFVGRTVAKNSVGLKSNVTGYLLEQAFSDGALVKQGEVLFRIDQREFLANLETARAKQAQAEAKLAQADIDLARVEPLAKAGAAPIQDLDNARTSQLSARADLRSAQAAVNNAEIALSYTTISAPFAGRISKGAFSSGTLISPSSGVLATIDQIDPISVEFTVSEQEILNYQARIVAGAVTAPGPNHLLVRATLINGVEAKDTGRIDFADIRFRPETGTALLRAVFANADGKLLPGQFVRVQLEGMVRKHAVLVPQGAVLQSPTGASVFTVGADGTAVNVPVVLGEWFERGWLVESGLTGGERLITDGLQKVRAGKPVEILAPAPATP